MVEQSLVSIIIVNYNGRTHLEKCLQSISKINYSNFEIIVVDNNSIDDSLEFVKNNYPNIMIIKLDKNYGFAEPNNIGAKNAKGDFFLFLNNDTIVSPNFIDEMIKVIKNDSKIAICQSLLLKPNGDIDSSGDFVDTLGRAFSSREKVTDVKEILSARGASMLVRKNAFWDLGGFDKNFFASFEDVELGWIAWIYGYKVVLIPNSIVYHTGGQTVQELSSDITFHGIKNTLLLRLVNFETRFVVSSIIKLFFVSFMRKCFGISVISDPEPAPPLPSFRKTLRGIVWILKNTKYICAKRKQVNSRRVRTTKELLEMGLIKKY